MKIKVNKLAVFDLDGTLYENNSHMEVLNLFYKDRYRSLGYRLFAFFLPKYFQRHIDVAFERISTSFIEKVQHEVRKSAVELLKKRVDEGYYPLIISNAPVVLVKIAAGKFGIDYRRADIGNKSMFLNEFDYEELFVCTDNSTDLDILALADYSVVYTDRKRKKIFSDLNNVTFLES